MSGRTGGGQKTCRSLDGTGRSLGLALLAAGSHALCGHLDIVREIELRGKEAASLTESLSTWTLKKDFLTRIELPSLRLALDH
eukprot:765942-Hanusia_phi.AAC.4